MNPKREAQPAPFHYADSDSPEHWLCIVAVQVHKKAHNSDTNGNVDKKYNFQ